MGFQLISERDSPAGLTIGLLCYLTPRIPNSCCSSQKASHGNISGTKGGIIDPLVSKRPENFLNKKKEKCQKWSKMVQNSQNGQNCLKWSKTVQNGGKWSNMVKIAKNGQN